MRRRLFVESLCHDFIKHTHRLNSGVRDSLNCEDNLPTAVHYDHPGDRVSAEVGCVDVSNGGRVPAGGKTVGDVHEYPF